MMNTQHQATCCNFISLRSKHFLQQSVLEKPHSASSSVTEQDLHQWKALPQKLFLKLYSFRKQNIMPELSRCLLWMVSLTQDIIRNMKVTITISSK
jgi:hypothetical protein